MDGRKSFYRGNLIWQMDEKTKFGRNLIWRLLKNLTLKWRKNSEKNAKTPLKESHFFKKFNLAGIKFGGWRKKLNLAGT